MPESDPQTALLILAGTLLVALLGLWLLLSGAARTADLGDRAGLLDREPATTRMARALDVRFRRTRAGRGLALRLHAGGVPFGPLDFVLRCLVGFLAIWAIGAFLLSNIAGFVAGCIGIGAALVWLDRRREQRALAFVGQLPEMSRLLANGASAGLSLVAAVEAASTDLEDPAGEELRRVVDELKLGRPLDEALESLRQRMPSREVSVLVTALVIQQRSGGDVVRALQDLGDALEVRKETLREVRTILSGSVFSSWLVAVLAAGTLILLNGIAPGVLDEMTGSPLGIMALVVSGTLYIVGFLLIRKTTRIEV